MARATRFSAGVSASMDSRIRCSRLSIAAIRLIIANVDGPGQGWKDRFVAGIVTSQGLARAVLDRARDDLDLALADLEAWVNRDSPSDDAVALDGLAAAMSRRLERYGAATELAGGYLRATLTGTGRARI